MFGPGARQRATMFPWSKYFDTGDIVNLLSGPDPKNENADEFVDSIYRLGLLPAVKDPWRQIEPYAFLWEGYQVLPPNALNALYHHHVIPRREYQIDFDQMWMTPERIYYQENARTRKSFDLPNGFAWNAPYEIARFFTPQERIGVVRTMETMLTFNDDAIRWPKGDGTFHNRYGVYTTWYLRIESQDPSNPLDPHFYRGPLFPPDELPGTAWNELPEWYEMRFLWGDYCPVYFITPPNSLLSLWIKFEIDSCDLAVQNIAGRFTGYTQAQSNMRAFRNVTTGW